MYAEVVKIPEERIAVLIGKNGKTKKEIEEKTNSSIFISKKGEVSIKGEDSGVYFASEVVKAIGRGFNPKIALKLLKNDFMLKVIDLHDFYNTKNSIIRIKGRVIGEKGKIRALIENSTDSYISIYGDTISIIAPYYTMDFAKEAVLKLVRGARHSTIERFLADAREKLMYIKLRGGKHESI